MICPICKLELVADECVRHSSADIIAHMDKESGESNDLLLSCALQFLMVSNCGVIAHSYMSTEEELCRVLFSRGILEQVSRGKFRVKETAAPVHRLVGLRLI